MPPIEILDIGVSTILGSRKYQEDRHAISKVGSLSFDESLACFAVYDGHGGPEVAEHARVNLISTINRRLGICDDFEQAIKDAMIEEDTTIRKTGMLQPGSTAALALVDVKAGTVVVGDLGDSHVVLAERNSERKGDWKAKCLSYAQKPWSKEERERIHDAGGKLNRVYGETRLGALNMSRSLGDMDYKQPAASWITSSSVIRDDLPKREGSISGDLISNEAHTLKRDLPPGRCLLMLATDGVGEGPAAERVGKLAAEMWDKKMTAQKIAEQLARKSEKQRYADNCTIIIVCIRNAAEDVNVSMR